MNSAKTPMKLASRFSNGMLVQQGIPVPVWGTAPLGSTITVCFVGQNLAGIIDSAKNKQQ
jgi:hypothetical protein